MAAEQGHAKAQYLLGIMYHGGQGVPQDTAEAARWYRRAAELGHAGGQCSLGGMYYCGKGVAKNRAEAAKWYLKAAEQGEVKAQQLLGIIYLTEHGVPPDGVLLYMFLNLAAARDVTAKDTEDEIARQMTPSQMAKSQRMDRDSKPARPSTLASHNTPGIENCR